MIYYENMDNKSHQNKNFQISIGELWAKSLEYNQENVQFIASIWRDGGHLGVCGFLLEKFDLTLIVWDKFLDSVFNFFYYFIGINILIFSFVYLMRF